MAYAAPANLSMPPREFIGLDVRAVQLLLTYHGYDPGKINGIANGPTRAAIAAFTAKHDLPATADHKDLRAVLLDRLPAWDGRGSLSSSAPTAPRAAPAASGAAPNVRVLQSLLEHLGWNPGSVDGKTGPRTRNAITGFLRSQGAVEYTEIDAELLAALENETRRGFGRNRNADARLVQRLLSIRGFDPGDIDGHVGPRTRVAITAFARAHRGSATDAVDAELLQALLACGNNGGEPRVGA